MTQLEKDLEMVKKMGSLLQHVKTQTSEICMEAVKQNGWALQFVKVQTPELCLEAVKQAGCALEYVNHQTEEICMTAVKRNGWALKYVKSQTPELCLLAVHQNGEALVRVKSQTPELCMAAVRQNGEALRYVISQTPEICMAAVRSGGHALGYVKDQTTELCIAAVKQYLGAVAYIKSDAWCYELALGLVKINGYLLRDIKKEYKKDKRILLEAVKNDGEVISIINQNYLTEEICIAAIKSSKASVFGYIHGTGLFNRSEKIIITALEENYDWLFLLSGDFLIHNRDLCVWLIDRIDEDYNNKCNIGTINKIESFVLPYIDLIATGLDAEVLKGNPELLKHVEVIDLKSYTKIIDYYITAEIELTKYQKRCLGRIKITRA